MKLIARLWIGILVLAVISPLGLILPSYFKAGTPFGESKLKTFWKAPIPDYAFSGQGQKGLLHLSLAYIISAIAGIAIIAAVTLIISRKLTKKGR